MNIIQVAGHLGSDPETRVTPSGQKVTTIRIASNSRRAGKDETTWWRITIWGDRFEKMMPYLKKGSAVICIGEMHKPEFYTDRDGNQQISLEITCEMLKFSPFGKSERSGEQQGQGQQGFAAAPAAPARSPAAPAPAAAKAQTQEFGDEDDLPF